MMRLNNDCLFHIFKYCDLREQLILCSVSDRFRDVILNVIWRKKYTTLRADSLEIPLTNDEYECFFALNVPNLEKLTIYNESCGWLRLYRPDLAFYFSHFYPSLVELDCREQSVKDDFVHWVVENCPNLRVLRIANSFVTGAYMKDLKKLQVLRMRKSYLEWEHLKDILSNLQLTSLALTEDDVELSFGKVLAGLEVITLEELQISGKAINEDFIANFHKLPKLKALELTNRKFETSSWKQLMQAIGSRIYSLHVYEYFYQNRHKIPTEDMFSKLTELKELHIWNFQQENLRCAFDIVKYSPKLLHIYLDFFSTDVAQFRDWCNELNAYLEQLNPLRPKVSIHIYTRREHSIFRSHYEFLQILKTQGPKMPKGTWDLRFELYN